MSWRDWKTMVRVVAYHSAVRLRDNVPPDGFLGQWARRILEGPEREGEPEAEGGALDEPAERRAHYSGVRLHPSSAGGYTERGADSEVYDPSSSDLSTDADDSPARRRPAGMAWEGHGAAAARQKAAQPADAALAVPVTEYAAGDIIANVFEVRRVLGCTERYASYVAHHGRWDTDVVVKVPRAELLADPRMRSTIEAAARGWTSLGFHPYIAYCHQVLAAGGAPAIAIEYVAGGSLRQWLSDRPVSSLRAALNIALQMCHALEHAHSRELWHGALTPENVLLTQEGGVRVTDFRIAGMQVREGWYAEPYTAPERWAGAAAGVQTDVFALGVCLSELFFGTRPYASTRQARREPAPLQAPAAEGGLPKPLAQMLQRCIAWEPQSRPAAAAEVREMLAEVHVELFGKASPFATLPEASWESDGWNNQAVTALLDGSALHAEEAWANALAADPGHLETTYNYGIVRWRRGELSDQQLIAQLEGSKAPQGRQWLAPYLRGLVHLERGDTEAALTQLEKAQAHAPDVGDIREALVLARARATASPQANRQCTGHLSFVAAVCITPDGRGVLSAGDDNVLCLWDAESGELQRTFEGHTRRVLSVSTAPDGTTALSGSDDRTLRLWDLKTGECLRTLRTAGTVFSTCLGANGLAVSTSGGTDSIVDLRGTLVQVWDVNKGRCLRTLEGHDSAVKAVALSADGRWILTGGDDQTLRLWDTSSGTCGRVLTGHQHYISRVVLNADGTRALSASWDGTLRLWDTAKTRCLRVFKGHEGIVTSVAFSEQRRLVISGGLDNTVRLWDLDSGRCLRTFYGHSGLVTGVDLSADGRIAASASWDQTVRVWPIPDVSREYCSPRLSVRATAAEPTPSQPDSEELLADAQYAVQRQQWAAALTALRAARQLPGGAENLRAARLWRRLSRVCPRVQLRDPRLISTIAAADRIDAVRLSPGGQWVLAAGRDRRLRVCDTEQGRWTHTLEGHSDRVLDLCVSANGGLALTASADHTLRQWDLTTGACVRVLAGHTSVVTGVCMSADQKWAFSVSYDHSLRQWDLATGDCRRVFSGHTRQVTAVCASADERWVITGSQDGTLHVWARATGSCVRTLTGHAGRVTALAVSNDGRWILSGGVDRTVRLWRLDNGEAAGCFQGHADTLVWVELASDGRWAFSASRDGSVVLWDLPAGSGAPMLPEVVGGLTAAALSSEGDWLAVAGADQQLRRWELDWELEAPPADHPPAASEDELLRKTS